jgi:hypothetical protein
MGGLGAAEVGFKAVVANQSGEVNSSLLGTIDHVL